MSDYLIIEVSDNRYVCHCFLEPTPISVTYKLSERQWKIGF